PGVQKSTWTRDKEAKAWFFHRFYDFQPDLNTSHPEVQAEILKIMGFWIQLGVSGFRMDAVPFVISTKGAKVRKPVEQYDMLRSLREFLQWRKGDAIILAEANVLPETDMEYFGKAGDRMHMMFNFQVNQHLFYALAASDSRPLAQALANSLMGTLPGTPVIRYGDEIGMGDNLDLPERNCARTPMQWSTEPHGGFTKSDKPVSPVIDEGPYGYQHVNVAKQRRDPNSM